MTTGILAFSFAKRSAHEEPNPVNINLAKATEKAVDHFRALGEDTVVVAQWEIARQLTYDNYRVDRTVTQHHASIKEGGKRYLNSDDVLREAQQLFGEREIKKVFVVANPFLHLPTIQKRVAAKALPLSATTRSRVSVSTATQGTCSGGAADRSSSVSTRPFRSSVKSSATTSVALASALQMHNSPVYG